MQRDLRRLADTRFDVVIVGAGFYGVTAAWDAAQRGLSVAIIDRGDFGAATSFNNLKTLHGGLRSLQSLNLPQARLFIRERRALARIVPHLVRPLPFVVPTTRHPKRSRFVLASGVMLSDLVASDRNDDLPDAATHLPRSRVLTREETLHLNPLIAPSGVMFSVRCPNGSIPSARSRSSLSRRSCSYSLTFSAMLAIYVCCPKVKVGR